MWFRAQVDLEELGLFSAQQTTLVLNDAFGEVDLDFEEQEEEEEEEEEEQVEIPEVDGEALMAALQEQFFVSDEANQMILAQVTSSAANIVSDISNVIKSLASNLKTVWERVTSIPGISSLHDKLMDIVKGFETKV